jgi:formate hydrogenlyase subunit 3/multisubunit Na+/H+ antiporter MnhD subunit
MTIHLLWLAVAVPLAAALLQLCRPQPGRISNAFWLIAAPLPALVAAVIAPLDSTFQVPWLLMGVVFRLTAVTQLFLLFTALLWLIAGWYAVRYTAHDAEQNRFTRYWLLSLTGNLGLIVAGDLVLFYTAFAVMTFAAYGLVLHQQTEIAARAGRLYIGMAVVGEALILSGLLLTAYHGQSIEITAAVAAMAASEAQPWVTACILLGFGVKTGLLTLHGWLPLAHPVAPTPASAVLSGSMIKAGLLGWILFLPGGHASYPIWGSVMMTLGLAGAFYAVVIGLFQSNPKTNLAYSSISQMGVITVCIGIGLADAADWSKAILIASIYALNHAFAKGALFMGVSVILAHPTSRILQRRLLFAGMTLAALAIAGAPMTGGALAKRALKYFAPKEHPVWSPVLEWALPLSAVATTLLLARLVVLLYRRTRASDYQPENHPGLTPPWIAALLAVTAMAWLTVDQFQMPISAAAFTAADWLKSGLPIIGGILLAALLFRQSALDRFSVPAGDVVVLIERLAAWIKRCWLTGPIARLDQHTLSLDPLLRALLAPEQPTRDKLLRAERRLSRFATSGTLLIVFLVIILLTLWPNG